MTELRSRVQVVLQDAGYHTWLSSVNRETVIVFEDDVVMGFVCIFDDAASMLERWRDMETALLGAHASALQRGGEKTWNVYCAFLSSAVADKAQIREIRWIEEDLERTRKLSACGLISRDQVLTALLPLLPIQYQPVLDSEEFDLSQRLRKRIADIAPSAINAALDDAISPAEIARMLGAQS
jgi:hypothetical protein